MLAARAGRRIAESIRRATGRTALAADAEQLLPVLAATAPADVFADPFADGGIQRRPVLVLLDDGSRDPAVLETRDRLVETAQAHGVRVETISSEADGDVARYAAMLSTGMYAAAYLQLGPRRLTRAIGSSDVPPPPSRCARPPMSAGFFGLLDDIARPRPPRRRLGR